MYACFFYQQPVHDAAFKIRQEKCPPSTPSNELLKLGKHIYYNCLGLIQFVL